MRPDIKITINGEYIEQGVIEATVDDAALDIVESKYGIAGLELSNRSRNALAREGARTVKDVLDLTRRREILNLWGIGDTRRKR